MLLFFYCGPMKVGKWMARYLPDEMTEICGARNFFPRSTNRNLAPLSFGSINPFSSRTMINRRALRARSHRGDLSPKSMKKFGKWGPNTSYRVSFSHGLLIDHRSLSDCHLLDFYFLRKMAADFYFFFYKWTAREVRQRAAQKFNLFFHALSNAVQGSLPVRLPKNSSGTWAASRTWTGFTKISTTRMQISRPLLNNFIFFLGEGGGEFIQFFWICKWACRWICIVRASGSFSHFFFFCFRRIFVRDAAVNGIVCCWLDQLSPGAWDGHNKKLQQGNHWNENSRQLLVWRHLFACSRCSPGEISTF